MIKYKIYHIENIKIGCTIDVEKRVKEQGFSNYVVLEEHDNIIKASEREIELQKEYGYPVDKIPYYISINHLKKAQNNIDYLKQGKKLVKWCNENGHYDKIHSLGGKAQGKINVLNGHMEKMRSKSNYNKKSVLVYNAFTNELVGSFDSLTQCAKSLNLCISKISTTLKGRRNYYKNYTFSLNNGSNN